MTEPDSQETRPISVAELLARNGSIGAPPVGGRRRRRRGNTDAVTVAELTGEIPIIADDDEPTTPSNGAPQQAEAEEMLPDPVNIYAGLDTEHDAEQDVEQEDAEQAVADQPAEATDEVDEFDEPPSYLHAVREPLFGGRFEDELGRAEPDYDDVPRRVSTVSPEPPSEEDEEEAEPSRAQQIGRGALIVVQSMLAVAFGAGLFIAFDELWKWNNIVALVLSVLVILGPLALLQSG